MQAKTFNARLTAAEMELLGRKARRRGLSKTALLKQWISQDEVPTVADAAVFEKRNHGNRRLLIKA